jgi:hypothetical protein
VCVRRTERLVVVMRVCNGRWSKGTCRWVSSINQLWEELCGRGKISEEAVGYSKNADLEAY